MDAVANTYNRFDLSFIKGEGCYLFNAKGEKYLDLVAGIAVCALGHSHPEFTEKIKKQCSKLLHVSNLYNIPPQKELAKKIVEKTFADAVFFCNSGAEANEAAIKLVRKFGAKINKNKTKILSFLNSFHGRTTGALSITGQEKYRKGFGDLLPNVEFAEFNNIKNIAEKFNDSVCGVFVEPIQGEGGINIADKAFLKTLRELCDKFNAVLVFDEVQTGVGRTGKLYAYEHFGVTPDLLASAKALGNGIPIGALMGKKQFMDVLSPGTHASTFGGNYIATVAGIALLEIFEKHDILNNVLESGKYFLNKLKKLQKEFDTIKDVRGIGLMLGIEFDFSASVIVKKLTTKNILTVPAGEKVLRFVPPLIIKKQEIDIAVEALCAALKEVESET